MNIFIKYKDLKKIIFYKYMNNNQKLNYSINQVDETVIFKNNSSFKNYCNLINQTTKTVRQFDVMDNAEVEILLEETGYYYIKVSNKYFIEDSNSFFYMTQTDKNKYIKQLQSNTFDNENVIKENIEYFKIPGTNQNDFCLINFIKKELIDFENLNNFCNNYNYKKKYINTSNLIIFSDDEKQHGITNNTIFSGYMFYKNKFVYGSPDLTNGIDFMNLDECGAYNFLTYDENKIKISNDYNCLARVYYFKNKDLFISTNNYHLLLKILSFCNVVKNIDEEQLILCLSFNCTQFRQPITNKFIIKNTYCLKPFQEIVIDKNTLSIKNKSSIGVFYSSSTFDESLYEDLVKKIAKDIINNLKSVLDNKRFKHFICELSGGKDSRVNYAALTNIKNAEKKVKLHTMAEDRDENDFKTAMSIANIYDFEYYYGSFKTNVNFDTDLKGYMKRQRSIYMSTKWLWSLKINHNNDLNIMAINGECAESFYVRYYSKLLKLSINKLQSVNKDEILKEYIKLLNKECILPTNDNYKLIYDNLLEVLNTSPGNVPLEQFDNLFNNYRSSIQIGGSERDYFGFASCMPIQSKNFWKAKKLAINNFVEEKLIFDLLRELNPILCQMNFGSDKLNSYREIMKKHSIWKEEQINNIKIPEYNDDDAKWKSKQELKTFYVNNPNNFKISNINDIKSLLYNNLIYNLKKLFDIDNKYKNIVIILLYSIEQNTTNVINENNQNPNKNINYVYLRLIHNKITSIIDSYNAIENNYNK